MNLRPGQIAILAAGVVLLVFSFFDFYDIDFADEDMTSAEVEEVCSNLDDYNIPEEMMAETELGCSVHGGASAWNFDLSAPLSLWPVLIGVAVAGAVAANAFSNFTPPEVAGFSAPQLFTGLAFSGAVIMLGFLVMGTEDQQSFGIGFWFLLLGSIALLAGTVMELLQGPGGSKPAPYGSAQGFGGPPPGPPGGYPPQGPPPGGGYPPQGPPGGYQPPGPPPPGQPGAF